MHFEFSQNLCSHTVNRPFHYQQIKAAVESFGTVAMNNDNSRKATDLSWCGNTQQYALPCGYSRLILKDKYIFNCCEKPTSLGLRGNSTKMLYKVERYAHYKRGHVVTRMKCHLLTKFMLDLDDFWPVVCELTMSRLYKNTDQKQLLLVSKQGHINWLYGEYCITSLLCNYVMLNKRTCKLI